MVTIGITWAEARTTYEDDEWNKTDRDSKINHMTYATHFDGSFNLIHSKMSTVWIPVKNDVSF